MSRVTCAACQEEGRDGCLECGQLRRPSAPAIDYRIEPHRYTITTLAWDVRVLKGNGVSWPTARDIGYSGVADRVELAAAIEELGEVTCERAYAEALR